MPYPSLNLDSDQLSVQFEDHSEGIYLGPWTELIVGNLRLTRLADGTIEVRAVVEEFASLQ